MGIEIEYPLGYASSGDSLFRDTGMVSSPVSTRFLRDFGTPSQQAAGLLCCSTAVENSNYPPEGQGCCSKVAGRLSPDLGAPSFIASGGAIYSPEYPLPIF